MKAVATFFIGLWTSVVVTFFAAASAGFAEDPKHQTASGVCLLLAIVTLTLGFAFMADVVRDTMTVTDSPEQAVLMEEKA